ncbi:hypothetical protein F5887DRAFT_990947 [Amanita rubescens]|nr:hypothetical protein F5887DRAFT_990947 [Amanita rubescens]
MDLPQAASPNLPIEIIGEVAGYLPTEDVLSLALTAKVVYEIAIGHFYRNISLWSIQEGSIAVGVQRRSIECMKALLSDQRKRQGVEMLTFRGIGVLTVRIDDQEITVPEPYSILIKKQRSEWIKTQPIFTDLANALLSSNFEFPRLETLFYDANALLTESDAERFLAFLRRHPRIRNVIVNGDHTRSFNKLTFSRAPDDFTSRFAHLERVVIYGPLLPLLLGFSFSTCQAFQGPNEFGPLIRESSLRDALPLKRVHLWWPQRVVRVVEDDGTAPNQVTVDLDLLDVMNALSSVCRFTLEDLSIAVDDSQVDKDLIELVSTRFPNLRVLSLGPARSNSVMRVRSQTFVRQMAEMLSKLKNLQHLVYSNTVEDSGEADRSLMDDGDQWSETVKHFEEHCPSLRFMQLYSLSWRKLRP